MAGLTIETKLRPCWIIGSNKSKTKALFHCWGFHSDVIDPSPLIGGHSGGVIARMSAIVEFEPRNGGCCFMTKKDKEALKRIENQLEAGYIDLIDYKDIDEVHLIRKALRLYKESGKEE